jgi:hypothetical protein
MHFALDEVHVSTLWCAFADERPMCVSQVFTGKGQLKGWHEQKAASILTVSIVLKPKLR